MRCWLAYKLSHRGVAFTDLTAHVFGDENDLLGFQFTRDWIKQRIDWTSETIFSAYFDNFTTVTDDSYWFFGHMCQHA